MDTDTLVVTCSSREAIRDTLLLALEGDSQFTLMAGNLCKVAAIADSESESLSALKKEVAPNLALVQKIITIANSIALSNGGAPFANLDGAIMKLGFDAVKHFTTTMMLASGFQRVMKNPHWQTEFRQAVAASVLAKKIAIRMGCRDSESISVITMLKGVGRMLAAVYAVDAYKRVLELSAKAPLRTMDDISEHVMGISFTELTQCAFKAWGLPDSLRKAMLPVGRPASEPCTTEAWMQTISSCASEYAEVVSIPNNFNYRHNSLSKDYSFFTTTVVADLPKMLSASDESASDTLRACGISVQYRSSINALEDSIGIPSKGFLIPTFETPIDISAQLSNTAALMSKLIADEADFSETASIAIEALVHSVQATRGVLVVATTAGKLVGKIGHNMQGAHVGKFNCEARFSVDIFHLALSQNKDLYIQDCNAAGFQRNLPSWFEGLSGAQHTDKGFYILPLISRKGTLGFVYLGFAEVPPPPRPEIQPAIQAVKELLILGMRMSGMPTVAAK